MCSTVLNAAFCIHLDTSNSDLNSITNKFPLPFETINARLETMTTTCFVGQLKSHPLQSLMQKTMQWWPLTWHMRSVLTRITQFTMWSMDPSYSCHRQPPGPKYKSTHSISILHFVGVFWRRSPCLRKHICISLPYRMDTSLTRWALRLLLTRIQDMHCKKDYVTLKREKKQTTKA